MYCLFSPLYIILIDPSLSRPIVPRFLFFLEIKLFRKDKVQSVNKSIKLVILVPIGKRELLGEVIVTYLDCNVLKIGTNYFMTTN